MVKRLRQKESERRERREEKRMTDDRLTTVLILVQANLVLRSKSVNLSRMLRLEL
jgi:hypothetical protein